MKTPARLGAFGAGLLAVLAIGAAVGAAVGPSPTRGEADAPPPAGEGVVSAEDGYRLVPAAAYAPTPLGRPTPRTTVDGYDVRLATERGDGGDVTATLSVSKGGRSVDLQPYLGADGHLVAMRSGDLAYAHVHPLESGDDEPGDGSVRFDATLASAGRYALFFDFKHAGTVHTAAFSFDQGVVTGTAEMEH